MLCDPGIPFAVAPLPRSCLLAQPPLSPWLELSMAPNDASKVRIRITPVLPNSSRKNSLKANRCPIVIVSVLVHALVILCSRLVISAPDSILEYHQAYLLG